MSFDSSATVRLHQGPFEKAQLRNERYVLSLDPEKLLAPYYRESGLKVDAERYGNWENSGLDGHTLGHVLSAAAHSAKATKNQEATQLVEKLVSGLKAAQDHLGTGYVGGIPHGIELWERISAGAVEPDSFGLNGAWVPWYNLHKLFAGLIDAHKLLATPHALDVVTGLADWWVAIAQTMTDHAFESMLRTEFGAMNAAYADLFELTGNDDYAWLAKRFTDRAFFEPLLAGEHTLPGMHANTQIAKAFGYARVGHATGSSDHLKAAAQLWKLVVDQHTYIFGGNSTREHFTTSLHAGFVSEQGPETCNTYNMLRLTNQLLAAPPETLEAAGITEHALLDYYEQALFNHVLPSQHPQTGGLVYFTPVRPDHYRVYSQPQECFWCCVGTGMENHARYAELLYSFERPEQPDAAAHLKVNLGVASNFSSLQERLDVDVLSNVNEDSQLVVRINHAPDHPVRISVRLPWWSRRNGKSVWHSDTQVWKPGTELRFPLAKRLTAHVIEPSPQENSLRWIAFQRGPQVLVSPTSQADLSGLHADDSRMGHAAQGPLRELSNMPIVTIDLAERAFQNLGDAAEQSLKLGVLDQVKVIHLDDVETACEDPVLQQFLDTTSPTSGHPAIALPVLMGDFETQAVKLQPLELTHDTRYTMYFPLASTEELDTTRERLTELDATVLGDVLFTLDFVASGEQQPESDHGFEGHRSYARHEGTEHWREALALTSQATPESADHTAGYFAYKLRTQGAQPRALRLQVGHQAESSAMNIEVNGVMLETLELPARPIESEPAFLHEIELPHELAYGELVDVKFETVATKTTPRVLGVRLVK